MDGIESCGGPRDRIGEYLGYTALTEVPRTFGGPMAQLTAISPTTVAPTDSSAPSAAPVAAPTMAPTVPCHAWVFCAVEAAACYQDAACVSLEDDIFTLTAEQVCADEAFAALYICMRSGGNMSDHCAKDSLLDVNCAGGTPAPTSSAPTASSAPTTAAPTNVNCNARLICPAEVATCQRSSPCVELENTAVASPTNLTTAQICSNDDFAALYECIRVGGTQPAACANAWLLSTDCTKAQNEAASSNRVSGISNWVSLSIMIGVAIGGVAVVVILVIVRKASRHQGPLQEHILGVNLAFDQGEDDTVYRKPLVLGEETGVIDA